MDESTIESSGNMADSVVDHGMGEIASKLENSLELQQEQPQEDSQDNHNDEDKEGDHNEEDDEDDEDDFGSFDEASFEDYQAPEPEETHYQEPKTALSPLDFQDPEQFLSKVDELLATIFLVFPDATSTPTTLLNAEASEKLDMLSRTPRLNPPNWIKLRIRHNLLIMLGVPINLDELDSANSVSISNTEKVSHNRRKSINEQDIHWENFSIPEVESFNLTPEQKQELLNKTGETLSRIEEDNLNNTSQLFLESSLESALDTKLAQMKTNYDQLIKLSAVWQDQMKELRNSQEVYESVVQNMVGYSQKLQRNEIIEQLHKTKGKKGKRTF